MTLNQASKKLDTDLLLAVNSSGLPLRVVELQIINLLNAVQMRLRQEEALEALEAAQPEEKPADAAKPADGDANA